MHSAAVIIPHRDDPVALDRCLGALGPCPDGVGIYVVDNGSTLDLSQVRAAHPHVVFLSEPSPGAAAARNRGVAGTDARNLFFLDCDCIPAPGWIAHALAAADTAEIIGGRVEIFCAPGAPLTGAAAFESVFAFDNRRYVERKGFSVTANLLTTREVFDRAGPFRANVSEDVDWCHRAVRAGARLRYDDDLRVRHPARSDWKGLSAKWRRMTREAFGLTQRPRAGWLAKAALLPLSALVHAPRLLTTAALESPGARMSALRTLLAIRCLRAWWMLLLFIGRPI